MVNMSYAWALFIACIVFFAGAGAKHIADGLIAGYRSMLLPDPPLVLEFEPELVLAQSVLAPFLKATERAEPEPEPEPPVEVIRARPERLPEPELERPVMFEETFAALFQRGHRPALVATAPPTEFEPFATGQYALVDRDLDDLPAAPVTVLEGPVLPARERFTGNKHKRSRTKHLAGVR